MRSQDVELVAVVLLAVLCLSGVWMLPGTVDLLVTGAEASYTSLAGTQMDPSVEFSTVTHLDAGWCELTGTADTGGADRVVVDVAGPDDLKTMTFDRPTTWAFDAPSNSTVTVYAVGFEEPSTEIVARGQLSSTCRLEVSRP